MELVCAKGSPAVRTTKDIVKTGRTRSAWRKGTYISEEDSLARDCFTSATIPTISIQGTLGSELGMAPTCRCCPRGDWLGKYVRAKLEFITTTAGAPSR